MFPLIQLPKKSEVNGLNNSRKDYLRPLVSINSTSEEVRSLEKLREIGKQSFMFPLIQLPKKSEVFLGIVRRPTRPCFH